MDLTLKRLSVYKADRPKLHVTFLVRQAKRDVPELEIWTIGDNREEW